MANEKAAKDAFAEQLAAEFLRSEPTEAERQRRVICYVDKNGAAVSRTLDGVEHVQPAFTYILRFLPPMAQGEQGSSQYREFPAAMIAAMEHMTDAEKVAYHARVQAAIKKDWEALDANPEVTAEWYEQERRKIDRFAKKVMAEDATRCLNERA